MKSATLKQTPLDIARAAWGEPMPDWVETLAVACSAKGSSQAKVADLLGRSGAMVSQVLRNIYPGDMTRIEERVRGVFMDGRVACPGMGEIATQACQDWRVKAAQVVIGNPLRQRMYRACHACPRFQMESQS
jgi:hypothetical protein